MARAPDPRIEQAKAMYLEGRKLIDIAKDLDLPEGTVRRWKSTHKWESERSDRNSERSVKKKQGGQPGNQNSKGHRNAAGSHKGAPPGNKNAEKDGAYSAVFFDMLTESERAFLEETPLGSREALEHEMKILKFRERRILAKIAEYEALPEDTLHTNSVLEMRAPQKGRDVSVNEKIYYTPNILPLA